MNRFMVWMGLGSLLLPVVAIPAAAERPRLLRSSPAPTSPGIRWHETLDSGWRESRRRNLPMVIYITSDNCHYCDAMKRDTWCDPSVRNRIAQGFIPIRLIRGRNYATLSRIKVEVYPMTLIGVPRGKIIGQRKGYQPPAALHGLLTETESRRLVR